MSTETEIRWKTTDRGFRQYAEAEGHEVRESSLATIPSLWVDDIEMSLAGAEDVRDSLPAGPWRDTLTVAIDQHYQVREPERGEWKAGSRCTLCGSHDTWLVNDVAGCNGCGVSESPTPGQKGERDA